MTPSQAQEVVLLVFGLFPGPALSVAEIDAQQALWRDLILDLDYEDAVRATKRVLAVAKFQPKPSEIREAIMQSAIGRARTGADAWGDVREAFHSKGYVRAPGVDFVFNDPIVMEVVLSLGWQELCASTNSAADRARFIDDYDERARRQRLDASTATLLGASTVAKQLGGVSGPPLTKVIEQRGGEAKRLGAGKRASK